MLIIAEQFEADMDYEYVEDCLLQRRVVVED